MNLFVELNAPSRPLASMIVLLAALALGACPEPAGGDNNTAPDAEGDVGGVDADSGNGNECTTHSDCGPFSGYCQDGECVSDPPGWGEDGDSWDDSDVSDTTDRSDTSDTSDNSDITDTAPECAFDTDCSPGFRCSDDLECVPMSDAGDVSSDDIAHDTEADDGGEGVSGDASCDAGERLNPLTGECVPIDGG